MRTSEEQVKESRSELSKGGGVCPEQDGSPKGTKEQRPKGGGRLGRRHGK